MTPTRFSPVESIKSAGRSILGCPIVLRSVRALGHGKAVVFMMHRFSNSELGIEGTDPRVLHDTLAQLRRANVTLMSLMDAVKHLNEGIPFPGPTAIFTVDDGYLDFETVAAPIFREFDCPVTVFLVTEFQSGRSWCWWDLVEYGLRKTNRPFITVDRFPHGAGQIWSTKTRADRFLAYTYIVESLKTVDDAERIAFLARFGTIVEVDFPDLPTEDYLPMSWDMIRRLESDIVSFGPHSRGHAVLSRLDEATMHEEIRGSWADLQQECRRPVPIFCYPAGLFGPREMKAVLDCGLVGAVSDQSGYLGMLRKREDLVRIPRFGFEPSVGSNCFRLSGLSRSSADFMDNG